MLARAASRAISIFGPLMLPDLSSTSTTAVGFSGGGSARTGSIFSNGVLGSSGELGIAVARDEDQSAARVHVSFDRQVLVRGKIVIGIIVQQDRIPILPRMSHRESRGHFHIHVGAA